MLAARLRQSAMLRQSSRVALRAFAASSSGAGSAANEQGKRVAVAAAALAAGAGLIAGAPLMLEQAPTSDSELAAYAQKRPTQKYEEAAPRQFPANTDDLNDPPPRPDLPIIPLEEVEEHADEDSMWFTFRGAVYDLTFFKLGHPGGTPRLLMAAGQDLEPYWEVYRQHFRGHIVAWMERHRIGNLSPEDMEKTKKMQFGDMYETDPIRDPNLLPCTMKPFCGEPRIDLLTKDYVTPNELFYVRNHLAVPDIDPDDYVLIVKGKGLKKHKFTLNDLKTMFPKHEVHTTLQCAGNRREDLHSSDRQIFIAPHWVIGAMSCAKWGGVRMRDVLKHCGMDVDAMALGEKTPTKWKHVQFEGYDIDETGFAYGGSIPIDKAVDGLGDCLFAYEMNGKQLPRDHGYPVRAIAPGHAGARQCKWLHKVIVSDEESSKPWHQKSYRGFAPDIDFEHDLSHWPPPRLDQAPIVQEMPVQSIVCNPSQNNLVGAKGATSIMVDGVAWSGGGRKVERVDVSIDGGKTWTAAELYKPIEQRRNRHWAWTQFSKIVPLPEDVQDRLLKGEQVKLDICSKAMNSDFNLQPETVAPYWNARGVCINNWYHVNIGLDPNREKGTIKRMNVSNEFNTNTPSGGKFDVPWGEHGWTIDPDHRTDPRANAAPEAKHF